MTWQETKDGIWPVFIRDTPRGQIYVTQVARGEWHWTLFYGRSGTTKIAEGKATTERDAKLASLSDRVA